MLPIVRSRPCTVKVPEKFWSVGPLMPFYLSLYKDQNVYLVSDWIEMRKKDTSSESLNSEEFRSGIEKSHLKKISLSLNAWMRTDLFLFTESTSSQGLKGHSEGHEQSEGNKVQERVQISWNKLHFCTVLTLFILSHMQTNGDLPGETVSPADRRAQGFP